VYLDVDCLWLARQSVGFAKESAIAKSAVPAYTVRQSTVGKY